MTGRKKAVCDWGLRGLGLVAAGLINTIGVGFLLVPNQFIDGGFSGVSFLISNATGLPMGLFIAILSLPFFLFGWKMLGTKFIVSSIIAVVSYSLFMLIPAPDLSGYEKVIPCVFGGLLSGIGSGLTIRLGGSLDGVDVVSVFLSKKTGISVGKIVLFFNVVIFLSAGLALGNWENALFSIIAYTVGVVAIDFVVTGIDKTNAVTVITDCGEEVAKAVSDRLGRGVTVISGHGYYSRAEKAFLYCVVNRFEMPVVKSIVKGADPDAFVTISDVSEVVGREIKLNPAVLRRKVPEVVHIGATVEKSEGRQVFLRRLKVTPREDLTLTSLCAELWNASFQNPKEEVLRGAFPMKAGEESLIPIGESVNVTFPLAGKFEFDYTLTANGEGYTYRMAEGSPAGDEYQATAEAITLAGAVCDVTFCFQVI